MSGSRYASGYSLDRTEKEGHLDKIEEEIGEISDSLYVNMKKLTMANVKELRQLIQQTIAAVEEEAKSGK